MGRGPFWKTRHSSVRSSFSHTLLSFFPAVFSLYVRMMTHFIFRLNSIDIKYQVWKLGVVFTDNVSLTTPEHSSPAINAACLLWSRWWHRWIKIQVLLPASVCVHTWCKSPGCVCVCEVYLIHLWLTLRRRTFVFTVWQCCTRCRWP